MTDLRDVVALALNGVGLGCAEFSPGGEDSGCPDCMDLLRYTDAVIDALAERSITEGSGACSCPSGDGSLRWPCPMHPPRLTYIDCTSRDGCPAVSHGPGCPAVER